ncbi:alpha/beta fold hydrolase [Ferruginibacter sp. HRS2-29]|uniref:alpha/beta fold hydrolase n=1 Tax=Ferruginibacter sp. HRS2-29 TaxID=2487334 RepID=UPI0020CD016B|nr:alpha/beta hydrolase [Ferruginibacter sp. HRS2-29]MCP9753298.1 alpha/beta hydrolase [Ferruginibacter sp. HRS2-29]
MLKKITFSGSDIHYTISGKGKPVVFVHGFAEDSHVWHHQAAAFEAGYQLIIPDLPGSGRSQILQKENASLEDYAECIRAILDNEQITQCIMIGHSMGGYITLAFAEKYPSLLSAFCLFHSSAYADDAEKVAARKKGIGFILEQGAEAFLKATIPGLFYDQGKSKGVMDELLQKSSSFLPEALIQYYTAMINRPDRTNVLREFNGAIGFIMGQHDKAVPFEQSLQQSHLPEMSYVYILRDSAHMGMLEETEKANGILSIFLQNN